MSIRPSSPVLIAGAGVAGLTTAIGLLRAGIPATVLEQAPALTEAGAGLSLAPGAAEELLSVDKTLWREEAAGIRKDMAEYGARVPPKLVAELDELERRLGA